MNSRLRNGILIATVAALTILPLFIVKQQATGTDDQAAMAVKALAPGYKPWFNSTFKAPGSEIDTILFTLQAAVGAGFIIYYVVYSRARARRNNPKRAH